MVERSLVEEFLGQLEGRGYLADRLEVPMLDQLEATPAMQDGSSQRADTAVDVWIYPVTLAGQNAALVAWWSGGRLRNLGYVVLPPVPADRAKHLKAQLAQLAWAGELEGWLAAPPGNWHLVADPVNAAEWEILLRDGLGEPVQVTTPLPPVELAANTARRVAASNSHAALLPAEFPARYRQQFVDRLWVRALVATGVLYAIGVVVYLAAVALLAVQTQKVEKQVAGISNQYTNTLQLQARIGVLKKRQALKYAALDCWKTVAEQLPAGIALQRFSFANGQRLSLSGTTTPDLINTLLDFNSTMQKATNNDRPMFDLHAGDAVSPRQTGNTVSWSFSLQLLNTEEAQ